MYSCSPSLKADWISESEAEKIFSKISRWIKPSPYGDNKIGVNFGLHFTGGEPFLNFKLLVRIIEIAKKFQIPSTFVETNCFWAEDFQKVEEKLRILYSTGLDGLLVSVNPFIVEKIPFENIKRVIKAGRKIFGENLIIYQEFFYEQLKALNIEGTISFEEYLNRAGIWSLNYVEFLPMGRSVYKLNYLFKKYPSEYFFGESCKRNLTNPWHTHIDNYGNYITGFCAGISLGKIKDIEENYFIVLEEYPVIKSLVSDIKHLYQLAKEFNYKEKKEGYISKCHLCVDIRKFLVEKTDKFRELTPEVFYKNLE